MSDSTATVLVVDDNDAERYFVARVLQKAGFEISEAATGGDALRLAANGPDLITLDVRLPDLSGFEVCRRLKSAVATRDIPVLHISASFTTPEYKAEGLDGGADGYLTHPVDPMELVATVRALLRVQRAEERVRAAAREWATTFDAIADAVCLTGNREEVVRCNLAFARLLELPFGGIIGRSLVELVPAVMPLTRGEPGGAGEVRFGDRIFRVSRSPSEMPAHAGPRAWVFGDVTDRRRAEEAAQARLQEIEAVYNSSPAGLCVLDRELRFRRINRRLAEMNGLAIEDHLGRTVREVVPEMADELEPKLRDVLDTGRPMLGLEVRGETVAQPGVERIWIETCYPLTAADGEIVGINIAAEEITEQRRAQEKLEQALRLEAVGRLAGGVAHETNNQMTVVLGCVNFALRQRSLPASIREDLEQIRTAAERTAGITAQLLAFGRRQIVRPEVVELNRVILRLRPILERSLGNRCRLALELGSELPHLRADVGQLEQVLLNLTLNASDAMSAGGLLTIRSFDATVDGDSLPGEVPPGRYVALSVSDTGSGMDEATLRQAFEPFFTTKPIGKGTGLGLSMVYGIVHQAGGHIKVSSVPGSGSAFEIFFPAVDPVADALSPEQPESDRPGRTILLVEDDPSVRSVLTRELAASRYVVLEAHGGQNALELIRLWRGRLDAVITDCRMAQMDGYELARQVGVLEPDLPVLFMSGYPDAEALQQLTREGRPYIQKPFTAEELSRFIERALEER